MKKPHGNPFWGYAAPCDSDSQIQRTQLSGQCGLYSLKGYFGVGLEEKEKLREPSFDIPQGGVPSENQNTSTMIHTTILKFKK